MRENGTSFQCNFAILLWWSVLLFEVTGVPGKNHRLATGHRQTLSLYTHTWVKIELEW